MTHDMTVTIYYGPLSWFAESMASKNSKSLLEIAYELDEASRVVKVIQQEPGDVDEVDLPKRNRPGHVAAETSDYASLNEHTISNFVGWIRLVNPKHLHLHNPPVHVHEQLRRSFSTQVKHYEYPVITRKTLIDFRDRFDGHLVGQEGVKESLLAAVYPLTRPERDKPVVLMFYGPSGVGKTESAQFVNGLLGGALLRKQFSMFHSDQFASYLFGGKHSEPSFAHDLLDRESGIILIDEFDKANPIFHSAFYQLFDSGVFEDKNYSVTLGSSLVICTSNYNSESDIQKELGDALYSRFDAVIRFNQLTVEEIRQVIDRLVSARVGELADDERENIDANSVRDLLYRYAENGNGNVRKLGKTVDEVISLLLVRSMLDEHDGST